MTRKAIKDLLMGFLPREWSMKTVAFKSTIDEVVDNFEQQLEIKDIAIEAQVKIIQQLKKDRDYWKLSFNKQVEASRGE